MILFSYLQQLQFRRTVWTFRFFVCYCTLHKVACCWSAWPVYFSSLPIMVGVKRSCPRSGTVFSHVSSDVVVVSVVAVVGLGLRLSDCNHAQLDYRGGYREDWRGAFIQANNSLCWLDIIPWNIQTDEHEFWFYSLLTVLVARVSLNFEEPKFSAQPSSTVKRHCQ